jgi:hypothetical protein
VVKPELDQLTEMYIKCHFIVNEIIKTDTGRYPRKYKKLELPSINKYFINLPYKSMTNFDFGAEVMSGLIVIHGLPNTNHRTTILFIAVVFEALDIRFPDYDRRKYKKRWIDECNEYIAKSKRILYAREKNADYKQTHLKWTKEWLRKVIGAQSNSSGMMSRKSLTTLRKISSSGDFSSVIMRK